MQAADLAPCDVLICLPVFNDWQSASVLSHLLDVHAPSLGKSVRLLWINDGSSEVPNDTASGEFKAVRSLGILHLRRNLGHQRAIAIATAFVHARCKTSYFVVMDADGEDLPEHVCMLLNECRLLDDRKIVFAKRAKRTEGLTFRLGYVAFKAVHRILTGKRVEIGNFCVIPANALERLVAISEIWNHFAAGIVKARFPIATVSLPRGKRIEGKSKMNFVSLVVHGLSAISVYAEIVGVRALACLLTISILSMFALGIVVYVRLFTELAIPGWATSAAGTLVLILLNLLTLMSSLILTVLQNRSAMGFLPVRDWEHYVARYESLYER